MQVAAWHRCGRIFATVVACAWALAAVPARAEMRLMLPARTIDATQPLRLSLVISGQDRVQAIALPERLRVAIAAERGDTVRIIDVARDPAVPASIELRPGDIRRVDYTGPIPESLHGEVRLQVLDVDGSAMLVTLQRADPASRDPAVAAAAASAIEPPPPVPQDVNRQDPGRLSFAEPSYAVIAGGSDETSKLQFSFKLRLFDPGAFGSRAVLDRIYLGYTQTSLWDLGAESAPFRDSIYRPSIYYLMADGGWRVGGNPVGIAAGWEHESNGKGDPESRSLQMAFVRPDFVFGDVDDWQVGFSPKLYYYIAKSDNRDIATYRGYGDFLVRVGRARGWQLAATLRKGTGSGKGSVELQWTYPVVQAFEGVPGYLMLQYFDGWGETLADYNLRSKSQLRFGYAFTR
jgi:outer membrane phospholipase A